MKALKWIIVSVVAVVVAVGVAGFVVLSTMDFEDLRETVQEQASAATGRDLVIAGPIDLKISMSPAITLEQVSFANADWGSRPQMVTLDRFEIEVALMPLFSGEIEVKRLVIVKPDILLETDAQGLGNWALEALSEASEEAAEAPEPGEEQEGFMGLPILHKVVIEDGRLTYRDGQTGEEIKLELTSFEARADGPGSPLELELKGVYNGESIKLSGTLGALSQLSDGPFPIKLAVEAGGAEIEVEGVIAQPLTGQGIDLKVAVRGESLASLGGLAGTELPPLGPYDVSARVKLQGESVVLTELAAKIGGSDLSGQATLALGARPAVSGAFASQLLDLADFAPEAAAEDTGKAGEAAEGPFVFTEDPLPLEGLQAADLDIKLTAATLRLQDKLELTGLDLTLKVNKGRLQIAPLVTTFAGGSLEANVDLDASKETPSLAVAVKGAGIDYGRLLKDMGVDDTIQGTMDLDVDLRGAGGSLRAIAASLNGKTELVSNEGVVSNRLLKIVGVGLGDIMGPLFGDEKDAKLNCIVSRFDIVNGLATSRAMIFDSEVFTVTGGGTLDLGSEKLDMKMDTGTREASIASLAVPFLIKGTLKQPTFVPDPIGTALGAAKVVGLFIAPPLAIGALIAERTVAGEGNACLEALEAVEKGEAPAAEKPKSTVETIVEQPAKVIEGAGKALKSLFGGGN